MTYRHGCAQGVWETVWMLCCLLMSVPFSASYSWISILYHIAKEGHFRDRWWACLSENHSYPPTFFFVRAPSPPPHCAAGGGGGASTSTIDGHQTISTIPKGSLIDISLLQSKRLTSACWCRRIRISIGVLGLFVYPCTRFLFSPKFYITVDAWSLSVSFHILLGEFLNI